MQLLQDYLKQESHKFAEQHLSKLKQHALLEKSREELFSQLSELEEKTNHLFIQIEEGRKNIIDLQKKLKTEKELDLEEINRQIIEKEKELQHYEHLYNVLKLKKMGVFACIQSINEKISKNQVINEYERLLLAIEMKPENQQFVNDFNQILFQLERLLKKQIVYKADVELDENGNLFISSFQLNIAE